MKYLKSALFLLFVAYQGIGLYGIESSGHDSPIIHLEDSIIVFEAVYTGENVDKQIKVTNTGTRELRISNVRGSCGLRVLAFPRQEIKPGESAYINIRYDTSRIGNFERILTIHSNAAKHTLKLHIRGEVLPKKDD